MPCFERFNRQPQEYREEVLPNACRKRVAIEAGVTEIWYEYVGLDGKVVGLHDFGMSAPGPEVMKERGIDAQHVIDAAKSLGERTHLGSVGLGGIVDESRGLRRGKIWQGQRFSLCFEGTKARVSPA